MARRPIAISGVYLFESEPLIADLDARGIQVGVASSVRRVLWDEAEVFPRANPTDLLLDPDQRSALELFAPARDQRSALELFAPARGGCLGDAAEAVGVDVVTVMASPVRRERC